MKNIFEEIIQIHKEKAYTTGKNDSEALSRPNESFYTNLHYATNLEMEKQGVADGDKTFERIKKVEEMLFEQLNIIKINSKNQKDHTNNKYCHYHCKKTHSSEECKALKQKFK